MWCDTDLSVAAPTRCALHFRNDSGRLLLGVSMGGAGGTVFILQRSEVTDNAGGMAISSLMTISPDDDDGVSDLVDDCLDTTSGAVVGATGCSIVQYCPCEVPWKTSGAYVSCVVGAAEDFVDAHLITEAEQDAIVSQAARSSCGKKR